MPSKGYFVEFEKPLLDPNGLPTKTAEAFLTNTEEDAMHPDDEKILKVAKEILVKFIELGRVSPTNFDEYFRSVFWTLKNTVVNARISDLETDPPAEQKTEED